MDCILGRDHSKKKKLYMDDTRRRICVNQSRPSRDSRPVLTDEQKKLVVETWKVVKEDISRVGVITFMSLFEKRPDVQQLFVPFRGLTKEELRNSDRLREHGLRVMGTVDKCIARFDREELMESLLTELGHKHVNYSIKLDYFDLIGPQLQCAIRPVLREAWTMEVEEAWSCFLSQLTHIMKEAMAL